MKDEAQVFAMFASLKVETKAEIANLLVVSEFSDMFPDDVNDLPPK